MPSWQLLFFVAYCVMQRCTASPIRTADQVILSLDETSFLDGFERLSKPQMHYNMTFGEIDMTKQPKKPLDHLSPLDFLRMDIMNTSLAVEHDLISENDTDCAVKGTNVLLAVPDKHGNSSRITFDPDVPNHSNVSEFFDFKSITMKPLGPAPFLTLAEVHAWRIRNGTALKVYSAYVGWGQKGFVNPIVGKFPKLWSGWGEDVNVVEILAYTQERKPWQLCIGRLEFELHEK